MKREQKHIDRIFQEKFKDFEASPSPNLWSKIEAKLEAKQPQKVFPLWWKISAIAASFALLLGSWIFYQNTFTSSSKPIVNQHNSGIQPFIEDAQVSSNQSLNKNPIGEENDEITSSQNSILKNSTNYRQGLTNITPSVEIDSETTKSAKSQLKNNFRITMDTDSVAESEEIISEYPSFFPDATFNGVIASLKNNLESKMVALDKLKTPDFTIVENKSNLDSESEVKEQLIAEGNPFTQLQMNQEEADQQNQKLTTKQEPLWSLKPQVSPVFNLAANSGASVDPMLVNNSSQGNTSISYGMLVTYKIANNLRLRSGVQQVNMSYTTNNVVFAPAIAGIASNQINFNGSANGFNVFNEVVYEANVSNPNARTFAASGNLQQQLGFMEVPLEVEWQLFEGKFGVYASGGASTLFLLQNSVGLRNETGLLNIGENAAANTASFSGNLGLGLEYQLSRRFNLNLEPSFRYQLNTFSNQVSGFTPYFFAIYSGVNYKF